MKLLWRHEKVPGLPCIRKHSILKLFFVLLVTLIVCQVIKDTPLDHANSLYAAESKPAKFTPTHLKSLIVHPQDSVNCLDFVINAGNEIFFNSQHIKPLAKELIHFFYLGITLPADSFWVNLNPTEPTKITSPLLTGTDAGKVLLETDLWLKKEACRLTDPRNAIGKKYWEILNSKLNQHGLLNVPIPSANRLWIIPAEAKLEVDGDRVSITSAKLEVCLESEYFSQQGQNPEPVAEQNPSTRMIQGCVSEAMKEAVLPTLEHNVNYAQDYAPLRQVYHALILAEYFKQKYWAKNTLYSHSVNQGYLDGLHSKQQWSKRKIFDAYVHSYKKGEYAFFQQEYDPYQFDMIQKYYFSGGIDFAGIPEALVLHDLAKTETASAIPEQSVSSPVIPGKEFIVKTYTPNAKRLWESLLDIVGPTNLSGIKVASDFVSSAVEADKSLAFTQPFSHSDWQNILSQHGLQKANIDHIQRNVRALDYFAEQEGLDDTDKEILEIALWLHDISKDKPLEDYIPENKKLASTLRLLVHHLEGADIAGKILAQRGYDEEFVKQVKNIIVKHMGPLQGPIPFGNRNVGFMELTRLVHLKNIEKAVNESSIARKAKLLEYIDQLKKGFPQPKEEKADKEGEDKLARIARDIDLLDLAADGITKVVHLRQTDSGFFKNERPETIRESFDSALQSAESVRKNLYTNSSGQIIEQLIQRIERFERETEKVFTSLEERFPVKEKPSEGILNRRSAESKKLYDGYVKENVVEYDRILKTGKFASSAAALTDKSLSSAIKDKQLAGVDLTEVGKFASSSVIRRALRRLDGRTIVHDGEEFVFKIEKGRNSSEWDASIVLRKFTDNREIGYFELSTEGSENINAGWVHVPKEDDKRKGFATLILSKVREIVPEGKNLVTELGDKESFELAASGEYISETPVGKLFSKSGWQVIDVSYYDDSGEYYQDPLEAIRPIRFEDGRIVITFRAQKDSAGARVSSPVVHESWHAVEAMLREGSRGSQNKINSFRAKYGHLEWKRERVSIQTLYTDNPTLARITEGYPKIQDFVKFSTAAPPIMVVIEHGKYIVRDGANRTIAAKIKGLNEIEAFVAIYDSNKAEISTEKTGQSTSSAVENDTIKGANEVDSQRLLGGAPGGDVGPGSTSSPLQDGTETEGLGGIDLRNLQIEVQEK